jgi:cytochrome c peroxidase
MSARYAAVVSTLFLVTFWLVSDDQVPQAFPPYDYDVPASANDSSLRELGRYLFYDPILSVDSSTSCASCHQQFSAFSHIDHALSHGVMGRIGKRNVPALQNLAWQTSFMWDGAIENLDMQSIHRCIWIRYDLNSENSLRSWTLCRKPCFSEFAIR